MLRAILALVGAGQRGVTQAGAPNALVGKLLADGLRNRNDEARVDAHGRFRVELSMFTGSAYVFESMMSSRTSRIWGALSRY